MSSEGSSTRGIEERFEILQSLADVGFWEHDVAEGTNWWSDQIYRMFGVEPGSCEPGGETVAQFLTPEENRRVHQAYAASVETGVLPDLVFRMTRADGVERRILVAGLVEYEESGAPARFVGIFQDVTDRVLAEEAARAASERLAQKEKLEAIGHLAGGVAHDFNNLLTVIVGSLELARRTLPPGSAAESDIEDALQAASRAGSVTRQLLAFARKRLVEPQAVMADTCVAELAKLLKPLLGERIELVVALDAPETPVLVDPGRLEQLVVNLAINGRDAMPEGGRLSITTARHGDTWVLAIADAGEGIPPEDLGHVFEPFFTTKGPGGTGLGLATCLAIVEQAGGALEVSNRDEGGAVFTARLPVAQREPDAAAAPALAGGRGRETVLVVEDDDLLRAVTVRGLTSQGYRVLEARNAEEALDQFRRGAPEVVFSDVVLPDLDGRELAERIRAFRPDVPILLTSGYTENEIAFTGALADRAGFLAKPYAPRALHAALRALIDA